MARGCSYNSRPAHVTLADIQQMVISPGCTINYENKDDHDHDNDEDDHDHDHDNDGDFFFFNMGRRLCRLYI